MGVGKTTQKDDIKDEERANGKREKVKKDKNRGDKEGNR